MSAAPATRSWPRPAVTGWRCWSSAAGILVLGPVEAVFQTTGRRLDGLLRRTFRCCRRARWASPSCGSGRSSWPARRPCRVADRRDHPSVDPDVSEPLVGGAFKVALSGLLLGRWMPVFVAQRCSWRARSWYWCCGRTWPSWTATPCGWAWRVGTWSRTSCCWPRPPPWPCTRSPRPVQGNGSPSRGRPGPGQRDTYRARGAERGSPAGRGGSRLTMTINGNREWTL